MPNTANKKRVRRLRYEYWRSKSNSQWYAHLRSGSQILFATEGYEQERNAIKPGKALDKFMPDGVKLVFAYITDPNLD